ncbi:MAG: formylglycine-generating enzyme family protein [Candidatus Magnetomorum sp.]|nr:formylglycine-generating enzyme family protein [Candidatus Magnetomorum sp.]
MNQPKLSIMVIIMLLLSGGTSIADTISIAIKANTATIIGVPYELTETQISHYIDPSKIKEIRSWNGSWGAEWGIYKNSEGDDFTEFEPGRGYYVIASENISITFEGEPTERLILTKGKNLVSLAAAKEKSVQKFLQDYRSQGWEISKIMALDGLWGKGWGAVTGSQFDAFKTIEAQRGYFVYVEKTGQVKRFTNSIGMEFVWIEAGTFMMGSPEDEPWRDSDETQHEVTLTQAYYMQTTEVTQGQWKAIMGSNPSYFQNCGDDCPVDTVNWNNVQEFITALNEKEKTSAYRLPTEAEWEYAARAGSTTALYNGPIEILGYRNAPALDSIAWYGGNSCVSYSGGYNCSSWSEKQYTCTSCGPHPVAQKQANAWGLYDISGNVYEWCSDWYNSYSTLPVTDPVGPDTGSYRVIRGGGWGSGARNCRSANRNGFSPGLGINYVGFRLVSPLRTVTESK